MKFCASYFKIQTKIIQSENNIITNYFNGFGLGTPSEKKKEDKWHSNVLEEFNYFLLVNKFWVFTVNVFVCVTSPCEAEKKMLLGLFFCPFFLQGR